MSCPFLRQGRARYCHAAPVRKLILDGPGATSEGRCASPDYRLCELAAKDEPGGARCPHLEEIHVQYCGASPVTRLVPFSDSQLSECVNTGYRYCDTYLSLARPKQDTPAPPDLLFSANHFWLEPDESSLCHIGIDAFLAETVGRVDGVTFVTAHGTHRPTVTLTVHGVEWPMVFPNPLLIERVNSRLRMDPARLTADPYGIGWLFEGWELPGKTRSGLIGGKQANAWHVEERERLAREIHETQEIGADGGYAQPGVAQLLSRPSLVGLCQKFFSGSEWDKGD
jgi:glycine cleavage system H lipoate-binding protein